MAEAESTVLDTYKKMLADDKDISQELIDALIKELDSDSPNSQVLADIIKLKKSALNND